MTMMMVAKLPFSYAKKHQVLLTEENDNVLCLVYVETLTPNVWQALSSYLTHPYVLKQVDDEVFSNLLAKTYETDSDVAMQIANELTEEKDLESLAHDIPTSTDLLDEQNDAPIIRLLNAILSRAIKDKASDVHIETFENTLSVRFRLDGVLHTILKPQRALAPLIISRIKVMARLNIAEKRLPQDGRMSIKIAGRNVDIRVSTIPTSHGERVVMRILDKSVVKLDLVHLGMSKEDLDLMEKIIRRPHGIILVTGPTGSGKTASLYAALSSLNETSCNILTVEDPVEYDIPGISQMQINPKIEMTFAKGLRAILRQDPDVVMVGEIRDSETASIAVQASLTGHLVFSTLHTNTAIGAINRLQDMGVESFLLATSLIAVIAQRLVRKLCQHCKVPVMMTEEEQILFSMDAPVQIYSPGHCAECHETGFNGRIGIYELININEKLQEAIHDRLPLHSLKKIAHENAHTLRQDGFVKVLSGVTSVSEILRVSSEDR
jgi:general secretion pathway protein E